MRAALIGISQRVTIAQPHGEKRDSLAFDWYPFLKDLGALWVAMPNDASSALDLAQQLKLDGLVLTGGDDIGLFPERDDTEAALLEWFKENERPVIGVCRGFQMIHKWLGGRLAPVSSAIHVARHHEINIEGQNKRTVNSYHNYTPDFTSQTALMKPFAFCLDDGSVEAARGENMLGLMWHPEREPVPQPEDILLFKKHLRLV